MSYYMTMAVDKKLNVSIIYACTLCNVVSTGPSGGFLWLTLVIWLSNNVKFVFLLVGQVGS